jgi:hypothetical protein
MKLTTAETSDPYFMDFVVRSSVVDHTRTNYISFNFLQQFFEPKRRRPKKPQKLWQMMLRPKRPHFVRAPSGEEAVRRWLPCKPAPTAKHGWLLLGKERAHKSAKKKVKRKDFMLEVARTQRIWELLVSFC